MERMKYTPRQPYVRFKGSAIEAVYQGLSPADRAVIGVLIMRITGLQIRNMGPALALEIVGSIAIKLAEDPRLK